MSDLRDLYQEMIFDHYRRPRNRRALADANHRAEGNNHCAVTGSRCICGSRTVS